jgi:hypothetical protein
VSINLHFRWCFPLRITNVERKGAELSRSMPRLTACLWASRAGRCARCHNGHGASDITPRCSVPTSSTDYGDRAGTASEESSNWEPLLNHCSNLILSFVRRFSTPKIPLLPLVFPKSGSPTPKGEVASCRAAYRAVTQHVAVHATPACSRNDRYTRCHNAHDASVFPPRCSVIAVSTDSVWLR